MNGASAGPAARRDDLTDADRWILGRLEEVRAEVDRRSTATSSAGPASRCTTSPGTSSATGTWSWPRCSWPRALRHTTAVLAAVLDALLKLLHPVMPFVTETLWKTLTGGESLVIAEWPEPSGIALDPAAAQRVADMQKLVTEVRRFRSDQGLDDRQRVPARLSASPRPTSTRRSRGHGRWPG